MAMTDPIADMLTRVRNANTAMHDTVKMPSSKMKESLAKILVREGYVAGYKISANDGKPGSTLEIELKYSTERVRSISGIQRVSKPGLRVYRQSDQLPRVLGGMGVAVLSTSQGLLTDREARQRRVGGEIVCFVW
jgi:small subunit ribosomal protein S8